MSVSNGIVKAPVGVEEVASLLGCATNVQACCTSPAINPFSLIRPFPPQSGVPGLEVRDMKTAPIAHQPSGGSGYNMVRCNWGWFVPAAGIPANVLGIRNVAWVRPQVVAGQDFGNIAHFDGYHHNEEPAVSVKLIANIGSPLVVAISPGIVQENIVSATGKGNNGGVVSIQEVLGNVRLGFSLYTGASMNTLVGHYLGTETIEGKSDTFVVEGPNVLPNTTYTVVPWATFATAIDQSGAQFFNLKIAASFEPVKSVTTNYAYLTFEAVSWQWTAQRMTFNIKATNTYPSAYILNNFRAYVQYMQGGTMTTKTVNLVPANSLSVPANSSSTLNGLYTTEIPYGVEINTLYLIAYSTQSGGDIESPMLEIDDSGSDAH